MRTLRHLAGRKPREPRKMVGYVILLSNEVHNYIRHLQVVTLDKYGPNRGIAEIPHITIKQGFEVQALQPFERYFDGLAQEIEPFEIAVTGIDCFDQGIVFADIRQDPRLHAIRSKVLRDLSEQFNVRPNSFEDDRYHFHATFAYGMTKENFAGARQAIKSIEVDLRFVFDTLGLFYYTGDVWIVYKQLALT